MRYLKNHLKPGRSMFGLRRSLTAAEVLRTLSYKRQSCGTHSTICCRNCSVRSGLPAGEAAYRRIKAVTP